MPPSWIGRQMIRNLKAAGMVLTLLLISEGVSVLYDGFTHARATRHGNLVMGVVLCFLALALLFSLGTREEK
jgi:hypothetical protein